MQPNKDGIRELRVSIQSQHSAWYVVGTQQIFKGMNRVFRVYEGEKRVREIERCWKDRWSKGFYEIKKENLRTRAVD